jgi:TPR repeat protein
MMKKISKRSFLILIPLVIGLWLWFSAESQTQNKPASSQNSSTASGQLSAQASPAPETAQTAASVAPAEGQSSNTITVEQLLAALEAQAKENDPRAMLALGNLYERGINNNPKRNLGTALGWYQKAAALEEPVAYFNVGTCYEVGLGTAPDQKKALDNFVKAADKGLAQAELKLASLYLNGQDVPLSIPMGMDYLTRAADQGFVQALMELGAIEYYGLFEQPRDLTKARDNFTKAANAGEPVAMKNLAAMNIAGEGMEANKAQGLTWYILAQQFGFNPPDLQTTIDEVKGGLKANEISQAEKNAQDWADKFKARVEAEQAINKAQAEAASTVGNASQSAE